MILSEYQLKVINAEICPYCKSETQIKTETEVYGKEYKGRQIICCKNYPDCDSYVGTHDDCKPLGRLANKNLRVLKKKAHDSFDMIWKNNLVKRNEAYKLLSDYLCLPKEYTHIGMFSEITCKKVIIWSLNFIANEIPNNKQSN